MSGRSQESGVSWQEVWELYRETTKRWGYVLEVSLNPPLLRRDGHFNPMAVIVTARVAGQRTGLHAQRGVTIGGVGGASTVAGAVHRALCELYWFFEDQEAERAAQAKF